MMKFNFSILKPRLIIAGVFLLLVSLYGVCQLLDEGTPQLREPTPFTSEECVQALKKAYPDRIKEIALKQGDWVLRVDDTWFYWAGGRLLTEEQRTKADTYDPQSFYSYPENMRDPASYTPEQKKAIIAQVDVIDKNPSKRSGAFFDAIWRARDKAEAWDRVKDINFLHYKISLHWELLEDLSAVEETIYDLAKKDPDVEKFINEIEDMAAWNWRVIAGTESRSFHSYGAAIDIITKSSKTQASYWRWTKDLDTEWFTTPFNKRFTPPASVIKAFEERGFIWGGSWFFFDSIHFEYRPELLYLNKLKK